MSHLSRPTIVLTLALGSTLIQADESEINNWAGFYAGIAIGSSSSTATPSTEVEYSGYFNDNSNGSDTDQLDPILQREIDGSVMSGSVLLGYHFQSGKLIYGLEADFTFADYSESSSEGPTNYVTAPSSTFTTTTNVENDYMFSLRPKIGYTNDKFLMHFSAGPVISKFKTTHTYSDTFGTGNSISFEDTETSIGLSANIGIDYLISSNLSLRTDYTYYSFSDILSGSSDVNNDGSDDITYGSDFTSQNIRLALTKQF